MFSKRHSAHAETPFVVAIASLFFGAPFAMWIVGANPNWPLWKQMLISAGSPFVGFLAILVLFFGFGFSFQAWEWWQDRWRHEIEKPSGSEGDNNG